MDKIKITEDLFNVLNDKQDKLVSNTNVKTINGNLGNTLNKGRK